MDLVPQSCRVILPTAPERAVSCNGGYVMTSWYDIMSLSASIPAGSKERFANYDQKQILESVGIVNDLVKKEAEVLGGYDKVFIGGFSQGCAISLATFLLHREKLGGVVGCSGALCADIDWQTVDLSLKKDSPMFIYHGTEDPMIPVALAEQSYAVMKEKGLEFEYTREPGMEHEVSNDEIRALKQFFYKHMP